MYICITSHQKRHSTLSLCLLALHQSAELGYARTRPPEHSRANSRQRPIHHSHPFGVDLAEAALHHPIKKNNSTPQPPPPAPRPALRPLTQHIPQHRVVPIFILMMHPHMSLQVIWTWVFVLVGEGGRTAVGVEGWWAKRALVAGRGVD